MSFAFGFKADDISDDEDVQQTMASTASDQENSIDSLSELIKPGFVDLNDTLRSLVNVRVTFDEYQTPGGNTVYRRQVFDIKHQIMTEIEESSSNEIHDILIGSSDDLDLKKDVYEGGFKLWECSYDLVDLIESYWSKNVLNYNSYLELGCGTSLPTAYLLSKVLSSGAPSTIHKVIISDFNVEVLRLVSIPNIIISWAMTLDPEERGSFMDPEVPLGADELMFTPALISKFSETLQQNKIDLLLVHGSWGRTFCDLVSQLLPDLILSSETIYSTESLPVILDMLLHFMKQNTNYLSLIAAKEYYFGVGGSIIEFMQKLLNKKPSTMAVETIGNNLGQLKRDIVRIMPLSQQ